MNKQDKNIKNSNKLTLAKQVFNAIQEESTLGSKEKDDIDIEDIIEVNGEDKDSGCVNPIKEPIREKTNTNTKQLALETIKKLEEFVQSLKDEYDS